MKLAKHLLTLAAALLCGIAVQGQTTDSVDVIHYDVALDLSEFSPFSGVATLDMRLTRPCAKIGLELIGTVDSILVDGVAVAQPDIDSIGTAGIAVGDTFTVTVYYHGRHNVESYGFGGFHFDNGMSYNLGVGFGTDPHPIGRAVFPCRDNFTDKATYTLHIKSHSGWTAECSGLPQSRSVDGEGCELSTWVIDQPVCTYLVGISQAAYNRYQTTAGGYPVTVGSTTLGTNTMQSVFELLDTVVPMFERCFGPYRWGRIGYIGTARGSMEHVNNIALAAQAMTSVFAEGQATIAHELGHAWFGNLVTCKEEGDMWINEGGASFTSEVAREATTGRKRANRYYQENLEKVILTTHITDGSYLPLHGMPHAITYGSTTYDKGWMVWHSLRGYLGEERFYAAVRQLMERCAFGNLDAYEIRDSLSLYSGVDLTEFFDFHVFNAGFVDYHVEATLSNSTNVSISVRQRTVGTDAVAHDNRVPIVFYNAAGDTCKRWVCFHGADTTISRMTLPIVPEYFVIDPNCEISDAATVGSVSTASGYDATEIAHFELRANSAEHNATYWVEHHYAPAFDIENVTGVVRPSNRYWVIRSSCPFNKGTEARFHYVRSGYSNSSTPDLDRGFYERSSTLDSMALLWRRTSREPWQVVTHRHTTDANDGYMLLDNLQTGEYTLAVIDSNLVGVAQATATPVEAILFPNPVRKGQPLSLEVPVEGTFETTVLDASGKQVWHQGGCRNGLKINPELPSGTYLVRIENNFISLQSKLIVL